MRRILTYIFAVAAMILGFSACTDRIEGFDETADASDMRLRLVLPADGATSRAEGSDTEFGNLDQNTTQQRNIDDVYVLIFGLEEGATDKTFQGIASNVTLGGANGDATRTIDCKFHGFTGTVDIVVVANLGNNMASTPNFSSLIGQTEKAVYNQLVYNFPEDGKILTDSRYLPMWGKIADKDLGKYVISSSVNLYRAVAKMSVANTAASFTMKEVYVFFGNDKGSIATTLIPDPNPSIQFSKPDVPASAVQFTLDKAQKYTIADGAQSIADIYLAEAKNKGATQPVKVVVGGVWTGEGLVENNGTNLSYYRIDLVDLYDEENKQSTTGTPFDIIRNHSYEFNITGVNNPGTPSPEAALTSDVAKLQVVITAYTEDYMRGVSDQYTLTTDQSVITLASNEDTEARNLTIWTDNVNGWTIEQIDEETPIPDWLQISAKSGPTETETTITLKPIGANDGVNYGMTRTARFYVVAGHIKKEITFIQPQPATANSYIVDGTGDGSGAARVYRLIVGLKGNGIEGSEPEGVDILEDDQTVVIEPAKIGVIWETHAGLVQLIDADDKVITNTEGSMSYATNFNRDAMTVRYKVNVNASSSSPIGGVEGGNALIGAFDENNNILWSWHIWVAPGLLNNDGSVKEDYVEKWTLNDYEVMDRNLGALSNRPVNNSSVASMGLLYQWGRKEPFIGANYCKDNFTGDGRIPVVHYYKDWSTIDFEAPGNSAYKSKAIRYCTENPTTLIYGTTSVTETDGYTRCNGLVNYAQNNAGIQAGGGNYLWGSDKGFENTEVGSKTIYDPCPPGYRVPPVNAFVFSARRLSNNSIRSTTRYAVTDTTLSKVFIRWHKANRGGTSTLERYYDTVNPKNDRPSTNFGYYSYVSAKERTDNKSSLSQNWQENLVYIPFNATSRQTDYINTATFYSYIYNGPFLSNANYYGFYLNYTRITEPAMAWDDTNNRYHYYNLANDDRKQISWFPLTGAYDPSQGISFKTSKIEGYSSITVNSFLWTNSSVDKADGTGTRRIPAAMFLHGTENQGTTSHGSGRHIHGMNQTNIQARPHYAGAVRCVKDKIKFIWEENTVTSTASIKRTEGSTTTISIVSIGGSWELVDPGASWIKVSPNRGTKTGSAGKTITLTMLSDQTAGTSTTLKFQIEGEPEVRTVTVTTTN